MNAHLRSLGARALEAGIASAALWLCACSSSSSNQPQSAADGQKTPSDEEVRLDRSTQLVNKFRGEIPDVVASRARCIVAIPGLHKGGLVVGGMGGSGFATCASRGVWSLPAPVNMGGGTFGAQIGYKSADVVAVIVSDSGAQALEAGNFKVGTSASAAAGPVGTSASVTGDVGVKSDILVYSDSSGLFAGATFNGMTVGSDDDATQALYGTKTDLASILERRVTLPQAAAVQRFRGAMNGAFASPAVGRGEPGVVGRAAASR